ncbi:hypothetical protein P148_SR1C00001G0773 [candidate division SR1 bacterium RAAC1_SR1_1]|nr:hypothetical protein P148_SR1C00001G0773 [candidate division SR1 bacterium RAAC1_SR1_1]
MYWSFCYCFLFLNFPLKFFKETIHIGDIFNLYISIYDKKDSYVN